MSRNKHDEEEKRAFSHGSSGATSDLASDPQKAIEEHRHINAPATRHVKPLADGEKVDHMAEREAQAEDRQEALLDEAIEETFPGSDPISPKHIT
jgi:hypothetical protein